MRILVYTAWFRPTLKRDTALFLLEGLRARGHEIVAVLGPGNLMGEDDFSEKCAERGFNHIDIHKDFLMPKTKWEKTMREDPKHHAEFLKWLDQFENLDIDLGLLYFSTWIPSDMAKLAKKGFINFHPGPLPDVRGFLPEDWAMLKPYKSFGGTLHHVDAEIDTGAIYALTTPAPIEFWDTPDSLMQNIAEYGLTDILDTIDKIAVGKITPQSQNPDDGTDASYALVYPYSIIDWKNDDHMSLHRKFQVFRGQAHRIVLKTDLHNYGRLEILDWELHQGVFPGRLGEVFKENRGHLFVKTLDGCAIITRFLPFKRDEKARPDMDRVDMFAMETISEGYRAPIYTTSMIESY